MHIQKMAKKISHGIIYSIVVAFLMSNISYAQDASLGVKGDQIEFGNLKKVSQFGHVVFADQPDKNTIGMLKDNDIKLVLNIRAFNENEGYDEQKAVEAEGIAYLQIPYMKGRSINGEALDEILDVVYAAGKNGTKMMLHCTRSERAGSVLGAALYRDLGFSREDAGVMAKEAGLTSEFLTKIHNEYLDGLK